MKVRIIGVVSGKGGVGKTTFVANVGLALKEFNKEVVAVDADLSTSNLGLHLGLYQFPVGLQEALEGDINILDTIYTHSSGLKVVPASISLSHLHKNFSPFRLKNLLIDLGSSTNLEGLILIDSPPGLEKGLYLALKACDEFIVITNPEIPAVTDALKVIKVAKEFGKEARGIVINRVRDAYELKPKEIEEMCEAHVIGQIPEDKLIKKSIFEKTPLVSYKPYSKASIAFKKIAANLVGEEYKPPRFLKLKRIFRR
jgi:septum site-determining protein MinD